MRDRTTFGHEDIRSACRTLKRFVDGEARRLAFCARRIEMVHGRLPGFDNDRCAAIADGTRTGVPWTWGSIGITIDGRRVKSMPTSWLDLLEPEFKGRVAAPDDPVGSFTLAAHVEGFDPSKTTKADGEKVFDLLSKVAAQTTGISPSFGDATRTARPTPKRPAAFPSTSERSTRLRRTSPPRECVMTSN